MNHGRISRCYYKKVMFLTTLITFSKPKSNLWVDDKQTLK
jgi:hypothetical protein